MAKVPCHAVPTCATGGMLGYSVSLPPLDMGAERFHLSAARDLAGRIRSRSAIASSTVRMADRIVVIKKTEPAWRSGTHERNCTALGGTYARLFKLQTTGYICDHFLYEEVTAAQQKSSDEHGLQHRLIV